MLIGLVIVLPSAGEKTVSTLVIALATKDAATTSSLSTTAIASDSLYALHQMPILKLYSSLTGELIGFPQIVSGLNLINWAALIAASVSRLSGD
jgi:hypothetical protein